MKRVLPLRVETDTAPADAPCVVRAWRAHEGELRAYLRHRAGSHELAEDLVQEVFVKALRHRAGFCALDNPRAWLFQVARNALIDQLRAQRPSDPLPADLEDAAADADCIEAIDALAECVPKVMQTLSAADAAILNACDLDGQTVAAYAQAHGLTLPAAKARLLRARQRLRAGLVTDCAVRFDEVGKVCCHGPRAKPAA